MGLKLVEIHKKPEFDPLMPVFRAGFTDPGTNLWPIFTADYLPSDQPHRAAALSESTDRFWAWHEHDPTSHWLKVIDTESGEILGGGRWALYEKGSPYDGHGEIEASWWPEVEPRQLATKLLNDFLATSARLMNRPHAFLNILFTHPSHRRKGVASLIMQWGLEHADRLGLESFIEATDLGKPVYEKFGFRVLERNELRAPERLMEVGKKGEKEELKGKELERTMLPFEWWSMLRDAKAA